MNKYTDSATKENHPSILSYAKHLSVMSIFSRIANNIDSVLVFHYLGATNVAVYSLARFPLSHIENFLNIAKDIILPKFAKQPIELIKKSIFRKVFYFLTFIALTTAIYLFIAPFVYTTLFPAYIESILLSQVMAISLLFKPGMLYNQVFQAHEYKKALYILRFTTPIIKIITLVILLPIYGIWGAVLALLITKSLSMVISVVLFYTHK